MTQMPNASLIKTPGTYTYLPINAPCTFFSTVKTCRFCLNEYNRIYQVHVRLNCAKKTAQMSTAGLIKIPSAYAYPPINAPRSFFSKVKTFRFLLKTIKQNLLSLFTLELCKKNGANADRELN